MIGSARFDIYCLDSYSEWSPEIVGQVNGQGYGSVLIGYYWLDWWWIAITFIKITVHDWPYLGLSHLKDQECCWNTGDTVIYNVGPDGGMTGLLLMISPRW